MKTFIRIMAVSALLCTPVMAAESDTESVTLLNGSTLHLEASGAMKMIDKDGDQVPIREGVPMETDDDRVIMMKNNALWLLMKRGTLEPKEKR